MKKLINGLLYDTSCAENLATHQRVFMPNVQQIEDLFRKRNGEFFLCTEFSIDGKQGELLRAMNLEWIREDIIPLNFIEAKAWSSKHLDPQIYTKLFGSIEE